MLTTRSTNLKAKSTFRCLHLKRCVITRLSTRVDHILAFIRDGIGVSDRLSEPQDLSDMAKFRFKMPPICFIVARSSAHNVIGCEGKLPWKLRSDLRRFRSLTIKHAVIMGRKTFDSIGQPLPNRFNVVVSRSRLLSETEIDLHGTDTKILHTKSTEDALFCSDIFTILNEAGKIFVIGGAEIYKRFSPVVDRVYLTEVHTELEGDAYFTEDFPRETWRLVHSEKVVKTPEDEFESSFHILDKKSSSNRLRSFSEIAAKKMTRHPYMRTVNNNDAKLIEGYAFRQSKNAASAQFHFSFPDA